MIEAILIGAAVYLILLGLGALGWGRRRTASRRPPWDLTRDPGYWIALERRRRLAQGRGRVRQCDAGETASRPARREPSKDDRRR